MTSWFFGKNGVNKCWCAQGVDPAHPKRAGTIVGTMAGIPQRTAAGFPDGRQNPLHDQEIS
jgi:hypothetical protein